MQKTGIIFCNEKGVIENQSLLLMKSIKQYLKQQDLMVFSCSPRDNHQPSSKTQSALIADGVIQVNQILNTELTDYPIANKVLASQFIEQRHPELNSLIFVDTDTVFINSIEQLQHNNKPALYLRPVDNKGPGSSGKNDANDAFWQQVFSLFGLDAPAALFNTTVRQDTIRHYFNAGFIWPHNLPGFFKQWYEDFMKIIESDLRPFGYKSRDGDDFRCLDQVALAVTASRYAAHLQVLPETYNYPLPFRPFMQLREHHPKFADLVHIHYHKWFQHPEFLDHVTSEDDKQSEQYQWLKRQLPLTPTIDDGFKC